MDQQHCTTQANSVALPDAQEQAAFAMGEATGENVSVEALLEQIDGLLGQDAQSFVDAYVQKGGE